MKTIWMRELLEKTSGLVKSDTYSLSLVDIVQKQASVTAVPSIGWPVEAA